MVPISVSSKTDDKDMANIISGRYIGYIGLFIIIIVYVIIAQFYSSAIPLGKAPDELTHYLYARFISQHERLPITRAERVEAGIRANFPPLYHFPVAFFMAAAEKRFTVVSGQYLENSPQLPVKHSQPEAFGESDMEIIPPLKVSWEPATRQLIDIVLSRATLIRTEDEQPPYRGEYLAWAIGRWVSIILGAGTIILTYFITRILFPLRPGLALTVAAFLAFIPAFLFISAVMNDDNMVGLTMAGYLLLLAWFLRGKDSPWLYIGMGLLIGLATTAKYNGGLIALSAALTFWLSAKYRNWGWRDITRRVALVWLATGLGASWWFIWGEIYFNEIEKHGLIVGVLRPFVPDTSIANRVLTFVSDSALSAGTSTDTYNLGHWMWRTFETTWALTIFGIEPYLAYWPIIILLACLTFFSLVGLYFTFRKGDPFQKSWLIAFGLHFLFVLPLPVIRFFLTYRIHDTAQGRHIFYPAAPVIVILLIAGWDYWLRPAHEKLIAGIGVGVLFIWAVGHGLYLWAAFPPPLPVRTTPGPQMVVDQDTSIIFKTHSFEEDHEVFALTGYEHHLIGDASVLELILRWQSLAQSVEDYRTEITLIDAVGVSQLRWISQPANGRFPVLAWQPGDIMRDTSYIPLAGLSPGNYQIRLRLLGWNDAPLTSMHGEEILALGKIVLKKIPQSTDTVLWQEGKQIVAQQPVSLFNNTPTYRYRSTIPVTLSQPAKVYLVGPNGQTYSPQTDVGQLYTFMVDHDWPSGEYWVYVDGVSTELVLHVENFSWNFTPPTVDFSLNIDFDGEVRLLGYSLPHRRVEAGEGIPLVLYWQSLHRMKNSYIVFDRLLDQQQQTWGGYDRVPKETYPTNFWVPGEVVSDGFAVPVDASTPDGVYNIVVGLYDEADSEATSLSLSRDGQLLEDSSVRIGPIKVGGPPADVVLSSVTPQNTISVDLGTLPIIRLLGYDVIQEESALKLVLYWESLGQTSQDWSIFAHLRDENGDTFAQKDGPAGSGLYPTSLWDTGELVVDTLTIPLSDIPQQNYQVVVGLYNLTTGERLSVSGYTNNEIPLGEIAVDK